MRPQHRRERNQARETLHGNGAILSSYSSHHSWGNIGYYFSSLIRFINAIGMTRMVINPDSWEGWYWGAMHHCGHSMRFGGFEIYGRLEDCLKHCDLIVFWSSDPEATNGNYGAFEGSIRRQWARELGFQMIHIDPHFNNTAALLRRQVDSDRSGHGQCSSPCHHLCVDYRRPVRQGLCQ